MKDPHILRVLLAVKSQLIHLKGIEYSKYYLCNISSETLDASDRDLFRNYLKNNLPFFSIAQFKFRKNISLFYPVWEGNDFDSRLKWLNKHIKKNTPKTDKSLYYCTVIMAILSAGIILGLLSIIVINYLSLTK